MSVKIGTTPETLVKSRLSRVVPIIYHSHPLHDAAGGGQKLGIRHPQHQVAGILAAAVQPQDLHLILLRLAAIDGGENGSRAALDLAGRGHGNGLCPVDKAAVGHLAEDAAVGVGRQGAHVTLHREVALQLAGIALLALLHRLHRGLHDGAAAEAHELGRVHIGDAVAQGAVAGGLGIVVGQGADARHAVTDPRTQAVHAVTAALGRIREGDQPLTPPHLHGYRQTAVFLQQRLELLGGLHPGVVDLQQKFTEYSQKIQYLEVPLG